MKKVARIRSYSLAFVLVLIIGFGSLCQSCTGSKEKKENMKRKDGVSSAMDEAWYISYEWAKGLQLIPHESTNKQNFDKLYEASPDWWNKAFEWLKTTNLDSIKPGTYIIEEANVRAIVSEAPAPKRENVKWEFHKNFSDIQYIIKSKAQMGVAPLLEATITEAYDSTKDIGFGEVEGKYYMAEPGAFFIFTSEDIHRPGINVDGYDTVKKVVIKVREKTEE